MGVAQKGSQLRSWCRRDVEAPEGVPVIKVEDTRYALALYQQHILTIRQRNACYRVTGTKGKTTTTYMVKSILESAGYKVGLIGTIEAIIGDEVIPASNTTPESYIIQEYFHKMVETGCDCCVMEVSSQGLMMHRTAGFVFEIGIFTNIEPDHIGPNEHASFEEYLACKSMLFRQCRLESSIKMMPMWEDLKRHTCEVETFGFSKDADIHAVNTKLVKRPGYLGCLYRRGTFEL